MNFEGVRHQVIQNFLNFPFPDSGVYKVEIDLDDIELGSSTITVNKV
jgi:hypothetical protein